MPSPTYSIYPAIGIARVGNAPTDFYIEPETYRGLPILPQGGKFTAKDFRDAQGRLRRQAARFRVFREDGAGAEEITLDSPGVKEIRWTVHLANKKASWYQFKPLTGVNGYPPNHPLRNPGVPPDKRHSLIIDAGPRQISGRDAGGPDHPVAFSRSTIPPGYKGGSFPPPDIKPSSIDTLGELRTDQQGRVLVLGGYGCSGSISATPELPHFANNDDWWDDTADGPVKATVVMTSGETIEATPAWIMVAPPRYAPQLSNLVTLYDAIFDVVVRRQGGRPDIFEAESWKSGPHGYRPFFETDIKPIFERGAGYPWVTAIPPKPHSFDFAKLADPREALNGFRQYYLDVIRPPGGENVLINPTSAAAHYVVSGQTMMPYLAGDDALTSPDTSTSKYLRLTDTQYFFLQQWAEGCFEPGSAPEPHPGHRLTRAVLDNCVGGAFSPGIEMSWLCRNPAIYSAPFRFKLRREIPDPLSLGLDTAAGLEPGDVCRSMALPWQADFNECASQEVAGRWLWWWPVQRPEFVYPPPEEGRTASRYMPDGGITSGRQVPWIGTDYDQKGPDYVQFPENVDMVHHWHELGFVFNIGTDEQPNFVEVERRLTTGRAPPKPS
jgi:hypothetical protein